MATTTLYTGGEGEGEGEGEEEAEQAARRRKPWGDTSHFCPVALQENGVLWPGSQDQAIRYRERLYYFNSEEAKERFQFDPTKYVAKGQPIQVHNTVTCIVILLSQILLQYMYQA